jgi:hypothetical protein
VPNSISTMLNPPRSANTQRVITAQLVIIIRPIITEL